MAEKKDEKKEVKKEDVKEVKNNTKKSETSKPTKTVKDTKKEAEKTENKKDDKKDKKQESAKVKEESKKQTQKVVDTKKFEVKKQKSSNKENNKKKNTSKIASIIIVVVVLAIVAVLTVLIVTSSDPKKTIDGMLTNLKEGDFEKAQEFMIGEEFLKDTNYKDETKKLLFDKISWKSNNISINGNEATVELEVTNKNFSVITSNCMKKMLSDLKAVLQGNISNDDLEKYFIEELKNEDVEMKTGTNSIKLEKQDLDKQTLFRE